MKKLVTTIVFLLLTYTYASAQHIPTTAPKKVGMDEARLKRADDIINEAIKDKEFPGAVLAVVRHGKLAYLQAYGQKQVEPKKEEMTTNTVFDLASLTKPLSTAIATMLLIERGEMRLLDNVSFYIPDFRPWQDSMGVKKKEVKIVNLLTHTSGLPPYAPVDELKKSYKTPNPAGLRTYIDSVKRESEPSTNFNYSCLNFITLQTIIEQITKQSLQDFMKTNVYTPLGMEYTDYKPTGQLLALTAPTERMKDGKILKGEVHDPLARVMLGGISGNAGLFSNAEDIAILATMLLNKGEYNGKRILSPLTVEAMSSVPRGYEEFGRTLGWDSFSPYASNNGDLLSKKTYGHTGYTGTSIIIDPENQTVVIFLTNRVHPEDKGSQVRLRSLIANIVAGSIIES